MATKRPQPFFPEGCPQAGPGEAGVIAALGGDSVPQTFMAAQPHAEGSNATRPAPRQTDNSGRWSRRSQVQNQQLISPLKM